MMSLFKNLNLYLGYLLAFVLIALISLVVYDATMRYLFSSGSIALQELEWHLFDVVILLGIAYTLKEGAHVRVDILYVSFSHRQKALVNMLASLFFILPFSLLLIYLGLDFVELSYMQNEASSNPGGLTHRFLVKSLLPLSFVFVLLQTLIDFVDALKIYRDPSLALDLEKEEHYEAGESGL